MNDSELSQATKERYSIRRFDIAEYLDNEEIIQAYIAEILRDGDQDELLQALSDIARAKGMAELAKQTGLGRESLYKTLAKGSKPRFDTIVKILAAFNLTLVPEIKTV